MTEVSGYTPPAKAKSRLIRFLALSARLSIELPSCCLETTSSQTFLRGKCLLYIPPFEVGLELRISEVYLPVWSDLHWIQALELWVPEVHTISACECGQICIVYTVIWRTPVWRSTIGLKHPEKSVVAGQHRLEHHIRLPNTNILFN
jgi:hypothetical protein